MTAGQEADPCERRPNSRATLSQAKAKVNYQARAHSGQMILVVIRHEAGLVAWWPKMIKGEFENDSRQPED